MNMTARFIAAGLAAGALLLAGCTSEPASDATSASPTATQASPSETSASPSGSPSPTEIAVVLCDKAAPETVAAIEAAMKPDFTVTQLVDVRTDDAATHAVLGFVEGPGLAVLAQWTGTGLEMADLAAADDFSAESSDAPRAGEPDEDTQRLLDNTVSCYTAQFAPDQDEDKKDNKNNN
jgi:hypothetical protein